jgi:phospholipid/cholesterol/gamma-HCH transport system permease protein
MRIPLVDALAARGLELGRIGLLPYQAVKGAVIEKGRGKRLVLRALAAQVYFTAVQPIAVFAFIALFSGFTFIVVSDILLRRNGLTSYIPAVVVTGLVREVLPLLLGLVLIGRSGNAIATELGYMRVNQEVDALDAAGVNIDWYLVFPRIVGVTIAAVGLMVVMGAIALAFGFALGNLLGFVSVALTFRHILAAMRFTTITFALSKALLFGLVIGTVNSHYGLSVGRSYTEIPRANAQGTILSLLLCFGVNGILAVYAFL